MTLISTRAVKDEDEDDVHHLSEIPEYKSVKTESDDIKLEDGEHSVLLKIKSEDGEHPGIKAEDEKHHIKLEAAHPEIKLEEEKDPGSVIMGTLFPNSKYSYLRFDELPFDYIHQVLSQHDEEDEDNPLTPKWWWEFVEIHRKYLSHLQKLAGAEFSPGSTVVWFGPRDGSTYFGQEFRVMYQDEGYWDWMTRRHNGCKTADYSRHLLLIEKQWKEHIEKYPDDEEWRHDNIYLDVNAGRHGRYRKSCPASKTVHLHFVDDDVYETLSRHVPDIELKGILHREDTPSQNVIRTPMKSELKAEEPSPKRRRLDSSPSVVIKSEVPDGM